MSVPLATQAGELHATPGMKALLLFAGLILSQWASASPFPWWFHTRPKPVLIDQQPATPPPHSTAATHTAPRPKPDPPPHPQEHQPAKSWFTQLLTHRSK